MSDITISKSRVIQAQSGRKKIRIKVFLRSPLAREGAWSFVLKAANTGLMFLSTVLLARLLGAEGYGIYAYAYALVTLLAMPAHAGLPALVMRETARGLAQERPDLVKGAWRWAGRVVAGLSLVVMLAIGPVLVIWQGGLGNPRGQTMAWALALVPLIALGNLRGAALRGLKRIVAGQLPEFFLRPGFFLLLVGAMLLLFPGQLSVPLAMILQAVASLGSFLVGAWLLWCHTPGVVRQARPTMEAKGWLVSSTLFALMSGVQVVNNQTATVLLGVFQTPQQVGIYRVAAQVAILAAFGLQAVNMVVAPRFAELYVCGQMDRLQRLVTISAWVVLAFNVLITVFFVFLGQLFLPLAFGAEFAASYLPLMILLAGQLVNSATGSVGILLNMTGHEQETVRGMAVAAALNVMLGLLWIPRWSILGAATATAVSMAVWNGLLWWSVRNRLGINSLAFGKILETMF